MLGQALRADSSSVELPSETEEAWKEYLYRHHVMPGLSHDEYMREPGMTIKWNTHIFHLEKTVERERQKRST